MANYWLAPIPQVDPFTVGVERLLVNGDLNWETFRSKLYAKRPHLLPMVKAGILPGQPEDVEAEICGFGAEPDFYAEGPVVFDGVFLVLSHCGQAFIDHLLSPEEQQKEFLEALAVQEEWNRSEIEWLSLMLDWCRQGNRVMLIKEG